LVAVTCVVYTTPAHKPPTTAEVSEAGTDVEPVTGDGQAVLVEPAAGVAFTP
jgi:hypothetical protein